VLNLHAGSYVIYYEGSVPEVPAGFVNVKPLSATAAVGHISPYSSGLTYSVGSRSGVAVAILQITGPGRFLIRATGAPGVPAGHLAFGSDIAGWIPLVGAPFVVLGGAGVIGIIALAFTRRRRASPPWPAPVRGPS
jgi:hypothetical protein